MIGRFQCFFQISQRLPPSTKLSEQHGAVDGRGFIVGVKFDDTVKDLQCFLRFAELRGQSSCGMCQRGDKIWIEQKAPLEIGQCLDGVSIH